MLSGKPMRYFFHTNDGTVVRDTDGTELPDGASACREAVQLMALLLREANGKADSWDVEVLDCSGAKVVTVTATCRPSPGVKP